jgi:SET domain-containing protein
LGLFALKNFVKGQLICPYYGEKLTQQQLDKRYPGESTCPYVVGDLLETGVSVYWDAARLRGIGAFSNTALNSDKTKSLRKSCNAEFVPLVSGTKLLHEVEPFRHYLWLVATRDIPKGSEILLYYGTDFRMNGFVHSTDFLLDTDLVQQ